MAGCVAGTIIDAFLQDMDVCNIVEKHIIISIYRSVCAISLSPWDTLDGSHGKTMEEK